MDIDFLRDKINNFIRLDVLLCTANEDDRNRIDRHLRLVHETSLYDCLDCTHNWFLRVGIRGSDWYFVFDEKFEYESNIGVRLMEFD